MDVNNWNYTVQLYSKLYVLTNESFHIKIFLPFSYKCIDFFTI